jgi:hypothetical protein
MMPQNMGQGPVYFYNSESKEQQEQRMTALYRQSQGMPATPAYSRPGSSQSQPPTLYSNGPAMMTPAASPPASYKPSIMLETDLATDSYFPSTPALSTAGSSVGSPKSFDVLQTPMNPMFSGLDGLEGSKEGIETVETSVLDWSSCGSPPMTPGKFFLNHSSTSHCITSTAMQPKSKQGNSQKKKTPPYAHLITQYYRRHIFFLVLFSVWRR